MIQTKWWKRNYDEWPEVTSDTDPAVILKMLELCCQSLNHEDENYIPAIQWAINFINQTFLYARVSK